VDYSLASSIKLHITYSTIVFRKIMCCIEKEGCTIYLH